MSAKFLEGFDYLRLAAEMTTRSASKKMNANEMPRGFMSVLLLVRWNNASTVQECEPKTRRKTAASPVCLAPDSPQRMAKNKNVARDLLLSWRDANRVLVRGETNILITVH